MTMRADQISVSKGIIIFCSVLYGLTWIVMTISWFMYREFPTEIKEYSTYMYSIAIAVYFGKSAYENGKKQLSYEVVSRMLDSDRTNMKI